MAPFDDASFQSTRPTLARVCDLIAADSELSLSRRRDLMSSMRTFIRYTGLDPQITNASFEACRGAMRRFEPGAANITRKRWSNIKADVSYVFARYNGSPTVQRRHRLSPGWQRLRDALPNHTFRVGLSRFIRFCDRSQIAPNDVSDGVAAQFLRHIRENTSVAAPNAVHRSACNLWNKAADRLSIWPQSRLLVPRYRQILCLPLSAFPSSLNADLENWVAAVSGRDVRSERAPDQALRPATISSKLHSIRVFASALVRCGVPVTEITHLAALLHPARFGQGMQYFRERNGKTAHVHRLAVCLLGIARHWARLDKDSLVELERITRRLRCRPKGLTQRNQLVLRQFDDPRNVYNLVNLPSRLVSIARQHPSKKRAALLVQTALAIEIELVAPIRLRNLINLRLDKHVVSSRPGKRGVFHLTIPAEEVKNKRPLEFELPEQTVRLLNFYTKHYLPVLASNDSKVLFPGAVGGRKHEVSLTGQICRAIRRYAGLRIHVHAFRHIAAKLFLDQHPGQYALVALLLGHASVQTTIDFYCELQARAAAKHYDEKILGRSFPRRPKK